MPAFDFTCDICSSQPENEYPYYASTNYGSGVALNPDTGEFFRITQMCRSCYNNRTYLEVQLVNCPCCFRQNLRLDSLSMMLFEDNNTRVMCPTCVTRNSFYCNCCEARIMYRHADRYTTASGDSICSDCYEESYFTCETCTDIYHQNMMVDEEEGRACCICRNCYSRARTRRLIHDYSYKPTPNFIRGSNDKKDMFFGCELEVNVGYDFDIEDKASKILSLMNESKEDRVYIKSDSSVGRGFEIVTHPHSYEEACKLWADRWSESIEGITSHASGNCGFHVHVSRRSLTNMHIQKIIVLINAPENGHLIRTIAQRDCTSYAVLKQDKRIGHCSHSEDRYEAVNLQNRNTIEFRIFRGNTRKERILKNLQFVKASIDFTRDRSYRELSSNNFCKFVSNNKKEFNHLYTFLVYKNFYPGVAVVREQVDN